VKAIALTIQVVTEIVNRRITAQYRFSGPHASGILAQRAQKTKGVPFVHRLTVF